MDISISVHNKKRNLALNTIHPMYPNKGTLDEVRVQKEPSNIYKNKLLTD